MPNDHEKSKQQKFEEWVRKKIMDQDVILANLLEILNGIKKDLDLGNLVRKDEPIKKKK